MYNNRQLIVGAIVGLLIPALVIWMIYAYKFSESTFSSFMEAAIKERAIAPIIALSLIGNLVLFFLFIAFNKLWAGRGVMIATLLYGIVMVYFKFIG